MRRRATILLALLLLGLPGCAALPTRSGEVTQRTTVETLLRAPDAPRLLVSGHRGAFFADSPLGGGNSRHAFAAAVRAGADLVELDVERTADGVPVVAHDAWPRERTWAAWQAEGRELRTLASILAWADGKVVLLLDAKTDDPEALVRVVREAGALDRVVVLGDPDEELRRLRAAAPTLALMARPRDPKTARAYAASPDPYLVLIHVDREWADDGVLAAIHAGGRRAFANSWDGGVLGELVGADRSADALFALGIDVVQTNDPAGAARARDARRRIAADRARVPPAGP